MMTLASEGPKGREGVRVGLWGAAQAIAFGLGGFLGAAAADLMQLLLANPAVAYGVVFAAEGLVFLLAARLAAMASGASSPTRLVAAQ
jgi:BCD family chlorophyll transporter-like MFS transporter